MTITQVNEPHVLQPPGVKPHRLDRKTELIDEDTLLKNNSNHGSKESITETTVHRREDKPAAEPPAKQEDVEEAAEEEAVEENEHSTNQVENEVEGNEINNDSPPPTNVQASLEQVHCVLNVEKYEITNKEQEVEADEEEEEEEEEEESEEKPEKNIKKNSVNGIDRATGSHSSPVRIPSSPVKPCQENDARSETKNTEEGKNNQQRTATTDARCRNGKQQTQLKLEEDSSAVRQGSPSVDITTSTKEAVTFVSPSSNTPLDNTIR